MSVSRPESTRPVPHWRQLRARGMAGVRRRKSGALATPILSWKFRDERSSAAVDLSARKLAAGLWRLQFSEVSGGGGGSGRALKCGVSDEFQSEHGIQSIRIISSLHSQGKAHAGEANSVLKSRLSSTFRKREIQSKSSYSWSYPNCEVEATTKWDPECLEANGEAYQTWNNMKLLKPQRNSTVSTISALKAELLRAQLQICKLEAHRLSSSRKIEHFLERLEEERILWRQKECKKIHVVLDDLRNELDKERKICRKFNVLNKNLVNDLADAKQSSRKILIDYEEERKRRQLLQEICNELAKQIGEDKVQVETLKRESLKIRKEVEEERRMMQLAEVWREERVQMKLVELKLAVEDKYSQMNKVMAALESFLKSKCKTLDMLEIRRAELIQQVAKSVNIQGIMELSFEGQEPADLLCVFEVLRETADGKDMEPFINYTTSNNNAPREHSECQGSPGIEENGWSKQSLCFGSNMEGLGENTGILDKESHFEEVKEGDYSVDLGEQGNHVSKCENGCMEMACQNSSYAEGGEGWSTTLGKRSEQRAFSGSNWNSDAVDGKFSEGGVSSVVINSPDMVSGERDLELIDSLGQWSSRENLDPHRRPGMTGCIEWPSSSGIRQNFLKAKLVEGRIDSQKSQPSRFLNQRVR